MHIDDDDDFRYLVRVVMERSGFDVLEAENGMVGLERCRNFAPSLILLDLQMPVLDGWGFLEAKDGDCRIAAIPVVVLSSIEAPVGASSVARQVAKSTPTQDLISIVQRAVESAQPRSS